MRAVVQRVMSASVTVDGEVVGKIGRGLLVLVGLREGDADADAEFVARKLLSLRLFESESGRAWDKGVKDMGLEVLLVSQFTLHAVLKGNKPDFHLAMPPVPARAQYDAFVQRVRAGHAAPGLVQEGLFGAMMQVALVNDGPVTIIVDSRDRGSSGGSATA